MHYSFSKFRRKKKKKKKKKKKQSVKVIEETTEFNAAIDKF